MCFNSLDHVMKPYLWGLLFKLNWVKQWNSIFKCWFNIKLFLYIGKKKMVFCAKRSKDCDIIIPSI